jgi:hypothetical protein
MPRIAVKVKRTYKIKQQNNYLNSQSKKQKNQPQKLKVNKVQKNYPSTING